MARAHSPADSDYAIALSKREESKEAAERAAADDRRSLTTLVEKLLMDYLRKKGYLKYQ
jgi:hypothetical protein